MREISKHAARIDQAMGSDRHRLRQRLRNIKRAAGDGRPIDRNQQQWLADLDRSIDLRRRRSAAVPDIRYDSDLPITAKVGEIREAVSQNPVTIVCGETGSGKSTQLPKICLDMGRGVDRMIGHTQPRRIAARSVAARVAEELGSQLGQAVGFKIRFTDSTRPETFIKLMTDGILLAETQGDRFLDQYDTIIVDEAHERSLNIDFLLGYVKRLLPKRQDLKLIITSATIDAASFSRHFTSPNTGQPAPVIEVSGRTYPVEIRHQPLETIGDEEGPEEMDAQDAVIQAVRELSHIDRGDILVFLPTERDIRETAKLLRSRGVAGDLQQTEILPLYARLSAKEQNRVFQPHPHRRIVLATNVAESSLTVPGIRFVIDTGTARISRYSPRRKMLRLPIEAISQASANQRAGRCGRVGPGICVRLYSEEDFTNRDRFTSPEIRRTNLASAILQTKALRLGAIEDFPFLDPPRADAIRDGYKTLFELGAIDDRRELTGLGRRLARLPVDPRIGRMILAAATEGCLADVLIIAAALEVQDPRERPVDKQQAADECHAQFADESSDFLSYLKLWDFYHQQRERLSRNQLRKACRQNFLSFNRMREWLEIHRQLKQLVQDAELERGGNSRPIGQRNRKQKPRKDAKTPARPEKRQGEDAERDRYERMHRSLLTGLLSNVAMRGSRHEYIGGGNHNLHLWPGSGIFSKSPPWTMAAELVETTQSYARTAARIDPAWIEPMADHLVKRSYSEPHWSRRQGSVMAYEKVSLFGLPIVQRRRVRYGPIDPEKAHALFIQHGLVEGQLQSRAEFYQHNRRLLDELESLATKTRRSDLFVEEYRQTVFYETRLPVDVYDNATLQRWLQKADGHAVRALFMTREDLLEDSLDATSDQFPARFSAGSMELPVEYAFEPGSDGDGVTVTVPQAAVGQLTAGQLGWLVPGLLEQKMLALIRSLPKSIRRNFVPAPETAKAAVAGLQFGHGSFLEAAAEALGKVRDEHVAASDFQVHKLPPHLQMHIRVVDTEGQPVTSGRDLKEIQRECAGTTAETLANVAESQWNRDGIREWDLDELPERVLVRSGGIEVMAYPTLVDRGDSVSLRLSDSADVAARQTRGALRRLLYIAEKNEFRSQVAWLPRLDEMKLHAATFCSAQSLEDQLAQLIADRAFFEKPITVRTADDFHRLRLAGRKQIVSAVQPVTRLAHPMLEAYHQAKLAAEEIRADRWQYVVEDVQEQLAHLLPDGRFIDTPWTWLRHYPRYFQAIHARLSKLPHSAGAKDRSKLEELQPFWQAYQARAVEHSERNMCDPELIQFRWMLEEFRVSLFAQELGTSQTVSAKRLEKHWAKTQR